jgi:site-specific recombinase XerD
MAGVDLRTVQELMSHQDIKQTVRYAHLFPSHKRQATELVESQCPEHSPANFHNLTVCPF